MTIRPDELSSADVATAGGDRVGIILGLTPAWPGASLAGRAFTVAGASGDNLALHRALADAAPGSILVVALSGESPAGHWGEIMCVAASAAGIKGLIIAGTVRDVARIAALRFPVFHVGFGPRPATKSNPGQLGHSIRIRGTEISPGDLVVADVDGIAIVPHQIVDQVLADVDDLQRREANLIRLLEQGVTTLEALEIDPLGGEHPSATPG